MKQKLVSIVFGCVFLFMGVLPAIREGRIDGGTLVGNPSLAENPIEFSFWFIFSLWVVVYTVITLFRKSSNDDETS